MLYNYHVHYCSVIHPEYRGDANFCGDPLVEAEKKNQIT
jgi:hypothetical protein